MEMKTPHIPPLKYIHRILQIPLWLPYKAVWKKLLTICKVKPYTMVEYPRLSVAYDLIHELETYNHVEGAIVECGSWNGGYVALMSYVSNLCGRERHVWAFDGFEGFPKPDKVDVTCKGKVGAEGSCGESASEICEQALRHTPNERVHVVAGWFEDTFPENAPHVGNVAILHIDCDYYGPVRHALETFAPLLSPGALVIVDDYSYFLGCKKAVDEYLAKHAHIVLVESVQHTAYFRIPPAISDANASHAPVRASSVV